jgi:outer membrane protein assembly factor BamB
MLTNARKDTAAGVCAGIALLALVLLIAVRDSGLPKCREMRGNRGEPAAPAKEKEGMKEHIGGVATGLAAVAAAVSVVTADVAVAADAVPVEKQRAFLRAPDGTGNYGATKLPTEWSEKDGKNIKWKTAIPLKGWSSPVVWGDMVVVTGADKDKRAIYGIDAATGKIAWTCEPTKNDKAANDYSTSTMDARWDELCYAGSTPATDGKKAIALFSNGQLVAADLATGKEIWQVVVGQPGGNQYGQCSAVLIHKNNAIICFEGDEQFLAAYSLDDGTRKWSAKRKGSTWASPVLAKSGDKTFAITAADPQVLVVDADSGAVAWSKELITEGVEYAYGPNPLVVGDMLVVSGERCGLIGVKLATGEKVWSYGKTGNVDKFSDGTSLTTDGKHVFHYFKSFLTCVDAKDGKQVKEKDMGEDAAYAAPFVADGKIYLATTGGGALVCKADPAADFETAGKGSVKDACDAIATIAGGCIYMRGDSTLYCIGAK